jgi:hypothetical protein
MKTHGKVLISFLIVMLLSSCGSSIRGRINSLANATPKDNATFFVKQNNPHSLTERHIKNLIHKEMEKVGLNPASSQDEADCLVGYKYRIGTGKTVVSSSPDFVVGGHNVHSTTVFPREFVIIIVERDYEANSNNPTGILWQAELLSRGSSSDISVLADYFIPQMFQRYGKTITNDTFDLPFN